MRRSSLILVTAASLAAGSQAGAQTVEAGPLKLKLIGRVQAQFSTTSVNEAEILSDGGRVTTPVPSTMFETRRVRFGSELEYEGWLTGKIEMEVGMARLFLRETWINLGIDPRFQVRMGQWKKPFSMLQLYSSTRWPIIERTVRMRGLQERYTTDDADSVMTFFRNRMLFGEEHELIDVMGYQNFDLGAAVRGTIGAFGYELGVFNGTGSDAADDTDGKSIAGRATFRPMKEQPLTLGAAFSTREFRLSATPAGITTREGTALEADLEWGDFRRAGLHVLAEAVTGRNLGVADGAANEEFMAAQAVAAWFRPLENERVEGWELAGRVSWGDPRRGLDGDEGTLLTPGINLYFSGRNRVMLNWDVFIPSGSQFTRHHAIRTQAQVYF